VKKRIIRALTYVASFALITFVLLEVGLRIVPSAIPAPVLIRFNEELRQSIATNRGFMTEDLTVAIDRDDRGPELRVLRPFAKISYPPEFAFAGDPGAVLAGVMDEIGFCNENGLYTEYRTFNVLTIGDSFTWCHTVNTGDTFSALVADRTDLSVYNLGASGVGLYEYVQILKTFGLEKRPDIVILNVYEGNDLRDALQYWEAVNTGSGEGKTDGISSAVLLRDAIRISFLGRHSYALNLAIGGASYLYSYYAYPEERRSQALDFGYSVRFSDGEINFNSRNLDVDEVIHAVELRDGNVELQVFSDALEAFVDLSNAHGFTPIVAYIPSAYSVYRDTLRFNDPMIAELMYGFNGRMRAFFSDEGRQLGYKFIDLTPDLRLAARGSLMREVMYFPTNLHLTRSGHEVIAERFVREFWSSSTGSE
jgi:hypothetical protein